MRRDLSLGLRSLFGVAALVAATQASAQPAPAPTQAQPAPAPAPAPTDAQPAPAPTQPAPSGAPAQPPDQGAPAQPMMPRQPPPMWGPSETPPPPPPPMHPHGPMFGPPGMPPWQGYPAPPQPEPERRPGVSKEGLPLTMRGQVGLDGGFFSAGDEDAAGGSIDLVGGYPLARHTFLDLRVPLAFGPDDVAIGNVDAGAHHVLEATDGLWLSIGGGIGLPTLNEDTFGAGAYEIGSVTGAHWYFSEFWPNSVPVRASFGLRGARGDLVSLRFFTNLVVMVGYEDNDEHELAIPHAIEVQIGHEIGGGLRLQGVALPTMEDAGQSTSFDRDLYQLALEPFFSTRDPAFARVGIMMPLDGQLGAPFVQSWGFRLATGVRLD